MHGVMRTFSGFSVNNLQKAKEFYTSVLGLSVEEQRGMGLWLVLPQGEKVFVYEKPNHTPGTFTVLNFVVENIDRTIDGLVAKGITFEKYQGMPQDEKRVLRGLSTDMGPDIAWFVDPSGNIFSLIQEK